MGPNGDNQWKAIARTIVVRSIPIAAFGWLASAYENYSQAGRLGMALLAVALLWLGPVLVFGYLVFAHGWARHKARRGAS